MEFSLNEMNVILKSKCKFSRNSSSSCCCCDGGGGSNGGGNGIIIIVIIITIIVSVIFQDNMNRKSKLVLSSLVLKLAEETKQSK